MATVKAYLTQYSKHRAHDLGGLSEQELADSVFYTNTIPPSDWIEIGTVDVTIHMHQLEDVLAQQLASLREEQRQNMAAAVERDTQIERAIQSLLAIEHSTVESEP